MNQQKHSHQLFFDDIFFTASYAMQWEITSKSKKSTSFLQVLISRNLCTLNILFLQNNYFFAKGNIKSFQDR